MIFKAKYKVGHPSNNGILRYLNADRANYADTAYSGIHPDILDRLIFLAASVKGCVRQNFRGVRLLIHRKTGVILAAAFGTEYFLRVDNAIKEAKRAGLRVATRWSGGERWNVSREFGKGWIIGDWQARETEWLQAVITRLIEETIEPESS